MNADEALQKVDALYKVLAGRRPEVDEFDNYYEGRQPLHFASSEWAEFHKNRYAGFADNWTAVVADALNERLRIVGISVEGDSESDAVRQLWSDWQRNDMPAQSSQGFLETIVAKRSAVIVWGGRDEVPQMTWEHPSQVVVEYAADNPRKRVSALKAWLDGDLEFATLYEPQAVWKFQRKAPTLLRNGRTLNGLFVSGSFLPNGGWEARQPAEDDTWPVVNPLGEVPVVEIRNRPRLGREPISDIAGAKSMQDAINLLWAYLFAAADHASLPARVIMGQEPPKLPILNSDGQKIGEKPVDIKELQHGRLLWLTGQNTKISQWDPARLDVFTDVVEIAVGHVGGQTRTPAHYFVANKGLSNINGETLVATETPLVKKAEEFQLFSSGDIRDILRLAALVRGERGLADSLTANSAQWANAGIRSDAQLADALLKKLQIGYPFEYLLELDGIGPEDRARILAMRERETADPYLRLMGEKDAAAGTTVGQ